MAVKEKLLVFLPFLKPAFEGKQGILAQIDHPAHAVLFSLEEMNLSVLDVQVIEFQAQGLPDPDAGPQKQENQSPVPDVVDHGNQFSDVGGLDGPGQGLRQLQSNTALKGRGSNDILFHQEVQKGHQEGQSRPDSGDP